jgi:hypothetical protein
MDTSRSNNQHLPLLLQVSLLLVFLAGILLLIVSSEALAETQWHVAKLLREVLRDLGVAFIVSCIVAGLFEIYRSQSHTFDGMKAVIDATLGEQISPEVWIELKDLIAAKECIRRRARIRLEFVKCDKLLPHQRILNVEYEYELHALTSKSTKVVVRHELDYQNRNADLGLPKFGRVVMQGQGKNRAYDHEDLRKCSSDGRFSIDVALQPRNRQPWIIRTERSEIINFPGAYNLYTPEFMKDVSVTVADYPPEISIEVIVRPLGKGQAMVKAGDTWSCEHLLLPGQGIEGKMKLAAATLFEENHEIHLFNRWPARGCGCIRRGVLKIERCLAGASRK